MISFSSYLPTPMLEELQPLLDYVFMEPVQDQHYIDFYKNYHGTYKLLDNGYIERANNALDFEDLVDYDFKVKADVVIAPDRLGDWKFNRSNAERLCERIGQERTGVVLAGRTAWAFEEQCEQLANTCSLICIPYTLNRNVLDPSFWPGTVTRFHLLGLRVPEDYSVYKSLEEEEQVQIYLDTAEPISAAYQYWVYDEKGFACFKRPKGYADLQLTKTQTDIARWNIAWLKKLLHTNQSLW